MPSVLTAAFQKNPVNHGDLAVWNNPAIQQMRRGALGGNSIDVSNSGGSLNVGLGFAGISDGVTEGTAQVTVPGSQTLAGSTPGLWHALEFSVSGTVATFYLTALAGETDESFMSLTMKGYYDAAKGGYYRIASRRVLAFVFVRAGTVLGRIVNTENGIGFKGIRMNPYYVGTSESIKYYNVIRIQYDSWNMDTVDGITLTNPYVIPYTRYRSYKITIIANSGYEWDGMSAGGMTIREEVTNNIIVARVIGGIFDSALYNNATAIIEMTLET